MTVNTFLASVEKKEWTKTSQRNIPTDKIWQLLLES